MNFKFLFKVIDFFTFVFNYMSVGGHVLQAPGEGIRYPRVISMGDYGLPSVGAGNKTPVFWKS